MRGIGLFRTHDGDFLMKILLAVLLVAAMLGTLGVLIAGVVGMVRADNDPERSNRLMRWRVILQAGALVLFALLMSVLRA